MLSSEPGGGVSWCKGVELHGDPHLQAPTWAKTLRDFRLLTPAEIAEWRETVATVNAGYSFESIMIHPPLYLARLTQELRRRGVTMQQRRVVDIEAEMRRVGAWACEVRLPGWGIGPCLKTLVREVPPSRSRHHTSSALWWTSPVPT